MKSENGIGWKKITSKQEAIIVVIIIAVISAIVTVTSDRNLQQEIRKESLAATGMEPDNATTTTETSPTTSITKNTGSTN
jgi:hypothetical protein